MRYCFFSADATRHEWGIKESARTEKVSVTLRVAYAAFNSANVDAAVTTLDPHIEWSEPAEFPEAVYIMDTRVTRPYLTQSRAAWAEVIGELGEFIPAGDRIVVFVHARVRSKNSNEWQEDAGIC